MISFNLLEADWNTKQQLSLLWSPLRDLAIQVSWQSCLKINLKVEGLEVKGPVFHLTLTLDTNIWSQHQSQNTPARNLSMLSVTNWTHPRLLYLLINSSFGESCCRDSAVWRHCAFSDVLTTLRPGTINKMVWGWVWSSRGEGRHVKTLKKYTKVLFA